MPTISIPPQIYKYGGPSVEGVQGPLAAFHTRLPRERILGYGSPWFWEGGSYGN